MDFSTLDLGLDMATDLLSLENELNLSFGDDLDLVTDFPGQLPITRIHDPSDPMKFLFEKKFEAMVDGEVVKTDRRNVNQKAPTRSCLSQSDRKRFSADMFVDKMTLPTIISIEGNEVLNMSMISRELMQDFRGLSTIVVSRATLAASVSFGYFEAFGTKIDDSADIFLRNSMITQLVGHVIPIFGQTRAAPTTGFGPKSQMLANHSKLEEGHKFGFEPVVIATSGDGPGDSGEIVCQGVIVSNKGLNFPVDDARRVSLGRRIEFEETMCWVLITHVYMPISYASLGPYPTTKSGDKYRYVETDGKNLFNDTFKWNEFMDEHKDLLGCGVSRFGFTDTKQTGKDMSRRLFPWSIKYAMDTLEWFRSRGKLEDFLINTPMSTGRRSKDRDDNPSGMDMRRFLLAELLLVGTPMENIIHGKSVEFDFAGCKVTGGGEGLYKRLQAYMQI
ncbi:hypothetical protein FR483_N696R [Paramecium bursaria Chlorella virus FR483]|uniref:Uncharacterized protein N696R n=1 Tax=Paramecium bursaria Chlorella virus FR483 TaxID=399781 RepID=A7J850_PBCVF|nr:hypothetical protein FR483_N696R [Paramecium bursaria Chlorella virus FR483]ABT15981.1 hypothetical protein FR483_N696R [Paramecium bursaria Chlorella virus FR483]